MALTRIKSGGLATGTVSQGGTVTSYESGGTTYVVHSFLSDGVFAVNKDVTVDFLLVGGGGGSAQAEGSQGSTGGGGAGGLVEGAGISVAGGNYIVSVGAGGAAGTSISTPAGNGEDTTALGDTAKGGGGAGD